MQSHDDAPRAVEFRTVPLMNREAAQLHARLGEHPDVDNAYLSGDDGEPWDGAVLPGDTSELTLLTTMERLREEPQIVPGSVVIGRFPQRAI